MRVVRRNALLLVHGINRLGLRDLVACSWNGRSWKRYGVEPKPSTSDMASHRSPELGSVVVDKTGLTGNYDFSLNWKSEGSANFNTPASDASVSSLLTALLEQLGSKPETVEGPMQVLVIDHAERPAEPTQTRGRSSLSKATSGRHSDSHSPEFRCPAGAFSSTEA
jgi:Protein of unknown function (DUF3738)